VRASLPRQRFDQLIALCWKYLFPLSLTLVLWSLALYSLASRWLRGSELLSLAASGGSGNGGGPGGPWWAWVLLGAGLGYGISKVWEDSGSYPLGTERLQTPEAVQAMLRRFAENSTAPGTFDIPLETQAWGGAPSQVTLQIQQYHPGNWQNALGYLAEGPPGGPYVPFSLSRMVGSLLPQEEMLWDMDTWGVLALGMAFALGLHNQQELQRHLRDATAVLRNLRNRG
jgi:hypothetical protein